ncbi:hypothetical protein ACVOMV_31905 [Mesorhizobium atlanticum]
MRVIFRCDPRLAEYLPRPVPARGVLPDWLRAMPATAYSAIHGRDIRTLKQCPPVVDAMTYGFMILLPCGRHRRPGQVFLGLGYSRTRYWQPSARALSFHTPGQLAGGPLPGPAKPRLNSTVSGPSRSRTAGRSTRRIPSIARIFPSGW